jgi:hypothetical protein
MKKLFSEEDDLLLKKFYAEKTNKELVELLNGQFSRDQIKWRAKSLKLSKLPETNLKSQQTRNTCWKEWEVEIVKRHYPNEGYLGCLKYLPNRTEQQITYKAQRLHIKVSEERRLQVQSTYYGVAKHTEETKQKMSLARLGKPFTQEHIDNLRKSCKRGIEHPNYKHGQSKNQYPDVFNIPLKAKIQKRDHYQCQVCKKKPSWGKLVIHHIDHNKENCIETNLITLCRSCHGKYHSPYNRDQLKQQQDFNDIISGQKKNVIDGNIYLATDQIAGNSGDIQLVTEISNDIRQSENIELQTISSQVS